jgi:hypothetical protein
VLAQELRTVDDEDGVRRLAVGWAKELATRQWKSLQLSSRGFAVYAVDDELVDLERNLRATVPRDVRQALEQP